MTAEEITDIIYDTLMGNTQYEQLDLSKVDNQEIDAKDCIMLFDYEDIHICIDVSVRDK